MSSSSSLPVGSLAEVVAKATGTSPLSCYQCGRCAAGCAQNVDGEMEISPTRMMRFLQMEATFAQDKPLAEDYARRALTADTCWLCAGCQACTTRCPQGVDIAGTMDVLRQEGLRRGQTSKSKRARDIQALHKTFLHESLKRGRIHELAMVAAYKLRTGHFLQDALLGPLMMAKGKLHLLPGKSPDTQAVKKAIDQINKGDH